MKGEKEMPFVRNPAGPVTGERGFVEDLTQFHMEAVVVGMSVVVDLLAPVLLDSHTRHKHIERREKEMLGYIVVQ